jgi:hypothetical protein
LVGRVFVYRVVVDLSRFTLVWSTSSTWSLLVLLVGLILGVEGIRVLLVLVLVGPRGFARLEADRGDVLIGQRSAYAWFLLS